MVVTMIMMIMTITTIAMTVTTIAMTLAVTRKGRGRRLALTNGEDPLAVPPTYHCPLAVPPTYHRPLAANSNCSLQVSIPV